MRLFILNIFGRLQSHFKNIKVKFHIFHFKTEILGIEKIEKNGKKHGSNDVFQIDFQIEGFDCYSMG
jgi:hypothetical protein